MRKPINKTVAFGMALTLLSILHLQSASIQTNWIAYNDHRPGTLIQVGQASPVPTTGNWGTSVRATPYDMRVGPGGNLTNYVNGQQLTAVLTMAPTGTPDDFGTCSEPGVPDGTHLNTPAAAIFHGVVDPGNANSVIGVRFSASTATLLTFSGLNPAKHYVFRGTSVRQGGYALRWTVSTIMGAQGWVDAHMNGTNVGPGVITSNNFPADLVAGQAAYDSGDNKQGVVVGWDFITPAPDGSFSVQSSNYVGHVPGGSLADKTIYGYAISSFMLAEVEVAAPAIVTQPPANTTVEQNRSFSLSVTASGLPIFYQWYKKNVGAIGGASSATYSVAQAALGDSGDYYVVVSNPLANVTSTVAHVTVNADVTPPGIVSAFCYPTFDPVAVSATLNQVVVEFSEPVQPGSVTDNFAYQLSDGSSPTSAVMTNDHTVVLTFSSALTADTPYTVTASGVLDLVGNNINNGGANNPASFRTWMQGPANGLLFEAYSSGAGVTIDVLTNSPNFPDSPFLRTNIYALDSRVVFPDDSQHANGVGTLMRGVFIPPVSGDWLFFLRCFDRGEFYLNPNGTDPAGKQFVFAEVTGNNPRDWNKFISIPFHLQGGHGYYVETRQQAGSGTGTDVIKVAALLSGNGTPPLGIPDTVVDTNSCMGGQVGSPYAPRDLGGALTISQDLADVHTDENNPVNFSLPLTNPSGLPLQYQWSRNGSAITGANGPTYTIQQPTVANDNGATFSVQVAKVGSVVTSRTATLTVVKDVHPPRVIGIFASYTNLSTVIVTFSEPMDVGASSDTFNYGFSGPTVPGTLGTMFDPTGQSVTLQLSSPLLLGATYSCDIQSCADIAGNVMVETNVSFIVGSDLPRLTISLFGTTQAMVSWPAPSTGFVLEQTDTPGVPWMPEGSTPVVASGFNTVTVNLGPGSKLYRLRQP